MRIETIHSNECEYTSRNTTVISRNIRMTTISYLQLRMCGESLFGSRPTLRRNYQFVHTSSLIPISCRISVILLANTSRTTSRPRWEFLSRERSLLDHDVTLLTFPLRHSFNVSPSLAHSRLFHGECTGQWRQVVHAVTNSSSVKLFEKGAA